MINNNKKIHASLSNVLVLNNTIFFFLISLKEWRQLQRQKQRTLLVLSVSYIYTMTCYFIHAYSVTHFRCLNRVQPQQWSALWCSETSCCKRPISSFLSWKFASSFSVAQIITITVFFLCIGTWISAKDTALQKLVEALESGKAQFRSLILDFNTTLGDGAAMITRAATHNPNIHCLSFSGCALSPKCVIDVVQSLKEWPDHSIQFLDLDRNYMDSRCVDEIIDLLTYPESRIQRIVLDSLW